MSRSESEAPPTPTGATATPRAVRIGVCAVLVALVFAIYAQVRDHEFVNYDDFVVLAAIDDGISAEGVGRTFTRHLLSNWIPVTWIALLADFELYGREPAGHHWTSVALHALNAVLLFLWLESMTAATGRSAFVAAVFAAHPLHVESVAWFAETKDVLSGAFFFGTLLAYRGYADARDSGRPAGAHYAIVTLLIALGLMAKPMLVTLPLVLLLVDYWPRGAMQGNTQGLPFDLGALRRAAIEKWLWFVLAAAACVMAVVMQSAGGSLSDTRFLSVFERLANAVDSSWAYLADSLWPSGLAAFYPLPDEFSVARAATGGLALAAVTAVALRGARRAPYGLVGWLWYLGMLVPVIGLIQVGSQARADRYMYLPQVGATIAFAWLAHDALQTRSWGRIVSRIGAVACILALALVAWLQVGYWRDTIALHTRAASVTHDNFRAHNGLAAALRRAGRIEESELHYVEAVRLAPRTARIRIGHAEVLAELGRLDEAIAAYEAGLALQPRHIRAHINLGHVFLRSDRFDRARQHFERAFEIDGGGGLAASGSVPFLISLQRGMARVLSHEGDDAGAIAHLEALLERRPNDASAHREIAGLLRRTGHGDRAQRHIERARELDRHPPPARKRR